MIDVEDARAIIYHLDAARLARRVWRAAARSLAAEGAASLGADEGAPFRLAAAVLDLQDGTLHVRGYRSWGGVEMPESLVVLAYADRVLVEDTERRVREGCVLPPSPEVIEESVARAVEDDGVGVSWDAIETQLRLAHEVAAERSRGRR